VHRKLFLPTYGVFDEARFVEAGTEVRAFDTRFGRFGVLNCEGNGIVDLKDRGWTVTGTNDEAGVARAVETFILRAAS
jgi:hypothetical protein